MRLLPLVLSLAAALLIAACSDDTDDDLEDPRRGRVGGVAELAVGAYASAGPEALADYMSQDALGQCSVEELVEALADETAPTGFRQLKGVDFDGETAEAVIIISTREGERDVVWTYVEEDGNWRISDMPGLENCPS